MAKFRTHMVRRDGAEAKSNHVHSIPDGHLTEGMLDKPSKDYLDVHTHLYEFEGNMLETAPAANEPGHVHTTELGDTSGPVKVEKEPGEPWRKDSAPEMFKGRVQRRGDRWFAISYDNQVVGNHSRKDGAERVLEAWEKEDATLRQA